MGIVANECTKFEDLKDYFIDTDNDPISLERYFKRLPNRGPS